MDYSVTEVINSLSFHMWTYVKIVSYSIHITQKQKKKPRQFMYQLCKMGFCYRAYANIQVTVAYTKHVLSFLCVSQEWKKKMDNFFVCEEKDTI